MSMNKEALLRQLNIQYPIIQAPMAGGVTTNELLYEVIQAGGLGMIGAGYLTKGKLEQQIIGLKEQTNGAFGVNVFVPNPFEWDESRISFAKRYLTPYFNKYGIVAETIPMPTFSEQLNTFRDQMEVIIEQGVPIVSFTFGIPEAKWVNHLKKNGIILIGTATTLKEALKVESAGLDMVVIQGNEAGGHSGRFLEINYEEPTDLFTLIPIVEKQCKIPIIAAGGIMDGITVKRALEHGASAVQMGTAFLLTKESGAHPLHKQAILNCNQDETVMTSVFSGKRARGIHNRFIEEMTPYVEEFPKFPVMNTLTKAVRKHAKINKT